MNFVVDNEGLNYCLQASPFMIVLVTVGFMRPPYIHEALALILTMSLFIRRKKNIFMSLCYSTIFLGSNIIFSP